MGDIRVRQCRHGVFNYASSDDLVGLSLEEYGEFSEREVDVFRKLLRLGDVAIEVGANIGALTVPMAQIVGPGGRVIAYEPGKLNVDLLRMNVAANGLDGVVQIIEKAASDQIGTIPVSYAEPNQHYPKVGRTVDGPVVERTTIDELGLEKLRFIKIDVDGHEVEVLNGARETIRRCKPFIYCENEGRPNSAELIGTLVDMGYRCYWYRPPLYNPDNYFKNPRNVFPRTVSIMMICVLEESDVIIHGCEEVSDLRPDKMMFEREIGRMGRRLHRKPEDLEARLLFAHYNNLMGRGAIALAALEENLQIDPTHVPSKAICGLMRLQRGDWERGFQDYELRYLKNAHTFGGNRQFDVPKWEGQHTEDPVLIWSEQGFGDSIMFVRFMCEVLLRAPNAILEVQPQLYELFTQSAIASRIIRKGRTLPPFKYHCSLPSTAAALRADSVMIGHRASGYLRAEPEMVKWWRDRSNPRIGLCAKGSPRSERPYTRDVPYPLLFPLMRKWGPVLELENDGQYDSFADTAAAIESLDLVITVDTSVAHLAGAMGKPTWLLLSTDPDWRWGLQGDSTIWYDNVRIFRQRAFMEWEPVLIDVDVALEQRREASAARGKAA